MPSEVLKFYSELLMFVFLISWIKNKLENMTENIIKVNTFVDKVERKFPRQILRENFFI